MAAVNFVVHDDEYWQGLGIEYVPSLFVNGQAVAYRGINATMRVREVVTEYRGYESREDIVEATSGLSTVTQVETGGTAIIVSYECRVSRPRVNEAGFWRATVTRKYQALYINGKWSCGSAENIFV